MNLILFIFVLSLVLSQGSESYQEREKATGELRLVAKKSTPAAVSILPLLLFGEKSADAEIAARSHKIAEEHFARHAVWAAKNLKPKNWVKLPWLDGLPPDHPYRWETIDYYLTKGRTVVPEGQQGGGSNGYPEYRLATAFWIHDQAGARMPDAEIVRLLEHMAKVEIYWRAHNRFPWN